jgi:hypothetical protein
MTDEPSEYPVDIFIGFDSLKFLFLDFHTSSIEQTDTERRSAVHTVAFTTSLMMTEA